MHCEHILFQGDNYASTSGGRVPSVVLHATLPLVALDVRGGVLWLLAKHWRGLTVETGDATDPSAGAASTRVSDGRELRTATQSAQLFFVLLPDTVVLNLEVVKGFPDCRELGYLSVH